MEASYFNVDVSSYEPLIETWILNAYAKQKNLKSILESEIKSDKMLNLNMSYGVVVALKKI